MIRNVTTNIALVCYNVQYIMLLCTVRYVLYHVTMYNMYCIMLQCTVHYLLYHVTVYSTVSTMYYMLLDCYSATVSTQ